MKLLDCKKVREMVAASRMSLWRWEREGTFPNRIQIGPRRFAWLESDILDWITCKVEGRPYVQRARQTSEGGAA